MFRLEQSAEREIAKERHPGRLHERDYWEQEQFPGKATFGAALLMLVFWVAVGYALWFYLLR